MVPPDGHDCDWKTYALALQAQLAETRAEQQAQKEQLEALKQKVFGKKREKMPSLKRELKRENPTKASEIQHKRLANAELRAKRIETEFQDVRVPDEERCCPQCGRKDLTTVSSNKPSSVTEYVPGYFRKRIYRRETLSCRCGKYIVTAPVPEKVFDKTQYGPGFIAHLVVSKCCDCIPIYRLEKQFQRLAIPMARSTMTELFHRAGEVLSPIAQRILALIAQSDLVLADETPQPMQGATTKPHIWAFIAGNLIAYQFSLTRSGETPKAVLGGTTGTLVVDMYTGYSAVTGVAGRKRAGCLAHARRKFWEAQQAAPEAHKALDFIRDIYRIEHPIQQDPQSTQEQLARVRKEQTTPLMGKFHAWLTEQKDLHPPRGVMAKAISYSLKNWQSLTLFLSDPKIPLDNNRSEGALRVVALGRKNFLFVGSKDAGKNLAALYTVVATCIANAVDPLAYLTDILMRLESTPLSQIDTLLPHNWLDSKRQSQ